MMAGVSVGNTRAAGREVVVARVRGEIGPAAARYLNRVVRDAEKRGAEAVVVQIDTPGGLEVSMREMVGRLLGAEIPVIAWVGPAGARAASAGTFLVMAADVAAMAPGTTLGAAHPIMVSGGTVISVDPVLLEKVTNDAAGYLRGLAAQRGRNAEWAESAVRASAVVGASDALRDHVVDLVAVSVDDLLRQLDGRKVAGPWGTRSLRTNGATVVEVGQTLAEIVVAVVGQPAVAYVLCLLGLVMIAIEIVTPTVGAFGVAGAICLVAGLVGFDSLPVRWAGVALLALGVSLVLAELKAGGHGVLAAGGVIAVAVGSWWMFPDSGPTVAGTMLRPSLWVSAVAVGMLAVLGGTVVAIGGAATRRRVVPIVPAPEEVGVAETDLSPCGSVHVRGESWSGRVEASDEVGGLVGIVTRGTTVRVIGRDGLTLLVTPIDRTAHGTPIAGRTQRTDVGTSERGEGRRWPP
jgi:membrane-bound serine protease (ClpP class)